MSALVQSFERRVADLEERIDKNSTAHVRKSVTSHFTAIESWGEV